MTDAADRQTLRDTIDDLDAKLLDLAAERRRLTPRIAAAKAAEGASVRDEAREREVIERAVARGRDLGLSARFIERLMQLMIDESLRGQRAHLDARADDATVRETTVAYLGGPGSYSHFAAHAHFADRYEAIQPVPCRDFAAVFRAVENQGAIYGVVPIENTTTGGIGEVYDHLLDSSLRIVGEHHYKVEHCLVGKAQEISQVSRVYGHPQALAQCRRFFDKHPSLTAHLATSTTRALERAMEEGEDAAAIAGADGARLFGLTILARDASDHAENYTRFIAMSLDATPPSEHLPCKMSLIFSTMDQPGSLMEALGAFHSERINMTKLESRPIPGNPWEEMFFVDFEGHEDEPRVRRALVSLEANARSLRVLGCYGSDRLKPAELDPKM